MQIKICGLSRAVDIQSVNRTKPDYCGFVINVPKSRRNVSVDQLKALRENLAVGITPVGVFVDEPVAHVAKLLNDDTLSIAQLHGHEDEEYLYALRAQTTRPIWQAFQVRSQEDVQRANSSTADFVLLDAGAGDGKTFDWSLLDAIDRPFALAGGLNIDNVPEAMQTSAVLLDVSSGAETDGLKDYNKMKTIVTMIKGE